MENLKVFNRVEDVQFLLEWVKTNDYIAFDTETTGVSKGSAIIGFSLAADTETGYYLALSYWDVQKQMLIDFPCKEQSAVIIEALKSKKLIMHNAVFDCSIVNDVYKVDLMPSVHTDTMILASIVDENKPVGLKELGTLIFGEDAKKEQIEMKESISKNGGVITKTNYELYKADYNLIGLYGAKDAILTMKLFYHLVPLLFQEGMDKFFYEDESMPLLRGPTYQLNTTGLLIDKQKLIQVKKQLESDISEAEAFIAQEIHSYIKDKFPGTKKTNTFNIGSNNQLAWLIFDKLGNEFGTLTNEGKQVCKNLSLRIPYNFKAKQEFIKACKQYKDRPYQPACLDVKTGKTTREKKVKDYWTYLSCDKETLAKFSGKYKWVAKLLEMSKNKKILTTYIEAIEEKAQYGVIRPSFLQHGTTSGRYSSRNPNFQNLPRKDKRVKSCIVSRPGKVFVGSDFSQLEPRVFASFSKDERLLRCFSDGDDFYSVIGVEIFDKLGCSVKKDENDPNCFAMKYPALRDIAKVVALSSTYGTTAPKMALSIKKDINTAQQIIDDYFEKFPSVKNLMITAHEEAKTTGKVSNLYGRLRRIPEAMKIPQIYGKNTPHAKLPAEARNLLNLAINHTIQSTGASIMNRASIAFYNSTRVKALNDPTWDQVKIVLQIHDELVIEAPEELGEEVVVLLRDCMENTVVLPGVALEAEPKIARNLADLK